MYNYLEDGDTRRLAVGAIHCPGDSVYSFYDCEIDRHVSDECLEERIYAAVECYEGMHSIYHCSILRCMFKHMLYTYTVCPGDEFLCGSGECVPYSYTCDGHIDCSDGSDEDSCGKVICV